MVTLDNGSTYVAPASVKLSGFKVGEKVSVSYRMSKGEGGERQDVRARPPARRRPRRGFVGRGQRLYLSSASDIEDGDLPRR
jgi:hypothetical protein